MFTTWTAHCVQRWRRSAAAARAPRCLSAPTARKWAVASRRYRRAQRLQGPARTEPRMSGVNGGLAYDIDEQQLPDQIKPLVQMIVRGPDSPAAFIDAMERIADWLWQQQQSANDRGTRPPDTLIPFLVDSLGYNNPVAARIALDLLVRLYGKGAVPVLLQGVGALNYAVNAYALRALGAIGDADAVFTVAKQCALRGPIPNVRRAAVRCLAQLKYEESANGRARCEDAVASLSSLVDDPDWTIRYALVWSLSHLLHRKFIEKPEITNILAHIANQDADVVVRARAQRALAQFNEATSSPASSTARCVHAADT